MTAQLGADCRLQQLNVVPSGQAYPVSDVVWTMTGGVPAANSLLDDLASVLGQ